MMLMTPLIRDEVVPLRTPYDFRLDSLGDHPFMRGRADYLYS